MLPHLFVEPTRAADAHRPQLRPQETGAQEVLEDEKHTRRGRKGSYPGSDWHLSIPQLRAVFIQIPRLLGRVQTMTTRAQLGESPEHSASRECHPMLGWSEGMARLTDTTTAFAFERVFLSAGSLAAPCGLPFSSQGLSTLMPAVAFSGGSLLEFEAQDSWPGEPVEGCHSRQPTAAAAIAAVDEKGSRKPMPFRRG
ncbi:hypothetical protein B0T14DRAFT_80158 [Immersiella caudata]|uniref:Uncharacterized protein n=1 Tax=Immersiella caudata TaxID=314043 RepID=A0AA39XHE1_9PEZI|nr:hypothetical protein B0T14DRAFT_80158 [Immersiella caudata]